MLSNFLDKHYRKSRLKLGKLIWNLKIFIWFHVCIDKIYGFYWFIFVIYDVRNLIYNLIKLHTRITILHSQTSVLLGISLSPLKS